MTGDVAKMRAAKKVMELVPGMGLFAARQVVDAVLNETKEKK